MAEAGKIIENASDAMDMEGLYGVLTRLGITVSLWGNMMRNLPEPMPDEWIDEAALMVWGKFWHE